MIDVQAVVRAWGVLERTMTPPQHGSKALAGAQMLRALCPEGILYACLLRDGEGTDLCVLDQHGHPKADGGARFAKHWQPWLASTRADPLPAIDLSATGHHLLAQPLEAKERRWGALGLAVPGQLSENARHTWQALLAMFADHWQARLALDAVSRDRQTLEHELPLQATLGHVSEVARVVVHEVNNFLNTALLHLSVLEKSIPPEFHQDLNEIRREGKQVSELIKQWHQYGQGSKSSTQALDFNQLLRDEVAALGREWFRQNRALTVDRSPHLSGLSDQGRHAVLDLAADLPLMTGSAHDIRRLCLFLARNVLASSGQGMVLFQTSATTGKIVLRIEDSGAEVPADKVVRFFEDLGEREALTHPLERVACKNIARRLRGKIHVQNRPGGGMIILLELPLNDA